MKKIESEPIKPFGINGQDLVDLFIKEREIIYEEAKSKYKGNLDEHNQTSVNHLLNLQDQANVETMVRVIHFNNRKITEDVLTTIEDYLFHKVKVYDGLGKANEVATRLDRLEAEITSRLKWLEVEVGK